MLLDIKRLRFLISIMPRTFYSKKQLITNAVRPQAQNLILKYSTTDMLS